MRSAIVLGGGALGSAVFRELSQRGIDTCLVDDSERASSAGSFSWINAAARTDPTYHALRLQGMVRHLVYSVPRSLARIGGVLSWDGDGRIEPVQGSTQLERVEDAHRRLVDAGHLSELVDRSGALAIDSSLNPGALPRTGIQYSGDEGWVDLPRLVARLQTDGAKAGGKIHRGVSGRLSVNTASDHVEEVTLANGRSIHADVVIVAAGKGTYGLLNEVGYAVPDNSSVGMLVRSKPVPKLTPRAIVRSPHVCVRPEARGALAFHSTGSEADVSDDAETSDVVVTEAVQKMLEHVRHLYDTTSIEVDRVDVVPRPVPGDSLPIVGRVPSSDNLYALASHSGATVSLILGELLGRELAEGQRSELLSNFRPDRFRAS